MASVEIQALVCTRCGGPLGAVVSLPAVVGCDFCGAVLSVGSGSLTVTKEGTPDELREEKHRLAVRTFFAELSELLQAKRAPYDALREASAKHLGTGGQTDAVARVTLALTADFAREAGVSLDGDSNVLARIAEAYLKALEKLRTASSYEINLPFIAATPAGPVHFARTVTPAILAQLAGRDPWVALAPVAPPGIPRPMCAGVPLPPTEPEEAPAKKKWWPFGR